MRTKTPSHVNTEKGVDPPLTPRNQGESTIHSDHLGHIYRSNPVLDNHEPPQLAHRAQKVNSTTILQLLQSRTPHTQNIIDTTFIDTTDNDVHELLHDNLISEFQPHDGTPHALRTGIIPGGSGEWRPPTPSTALPTQYCKIYDAVAKSNLTNVDGPRLRIPSQLCVPAWFSISTGHEADIFVLDGIQFGFSMEYLQRDIPHSQTTQNHPSAINYPKHVQDYIATELKHQALIGPFHIPPFNRFHISPLMTRPKTNSDNRRIIVDLSYPDGGVNKWVMKGFSQGEFIHHHLPTISQAVDAITELSHSDVYLSSIDISRAYRNFRSCPRDWPLLGIIYDQKIYLDTALPFGSRMSSYYMQKIAEFICRALANHGLKTLMYLDDLLIISDSQSQAHLQYDFALQLIQSLGLPVSVNKLVPPSKILVWLGICFDTTQKTISIPQNKLTEISVFLQSLTDKQAIPLKTAQKAVGFINHLSKCVEPARLFMSRILAEIRKAFPSNRIPISPQVKSDLNWFNNFLIQYNGVTLIKDTNINNIISADACTTGFGAYDSEKAYAFEISEKLQKLSSTQLECVNCLLAVRTFITIADAGSTSLLNCDNMPTIFAYAHGRAKDPVLAACSRAMWYHSEQCQVRMVYVHKPGVQMELADALSRYHLGDKYKQIVESHIQAKKLVRILPDYKMLDFSKFL